jgi:hypothetical protein
MNDYTVGTSVPQKKEPQVTTEVSRFQRLSQETQKMVSELENRLQPVLRDIPPSAGDGSNKLAEYKVGLASVLAAENDNLGFIAARIESILSRLEI